MPAVTIRFPLVSRLLLCAESLAAGWAALLLPPTDGVFLPLLGAAGAALLWVWTGRTLRLTPCALTLQGSRWTDSVRMLRRRTVTQILCFAPPLLRLAGCRIVVLSTPAGRIWLPGLRRTDAAELLAWYRE